MEQYKGIPVAKGVAIGRIYYYFKEKQEIIKEKVENTEKEIKRYQDARAEAAEQLKLLYNKALKTAGEVEAQIFEVHSMMVEDEDYNDDIKNIICEEKVNAEYAVFTVGAKFAQIFANLDDEYLQARSADIKDVSNRLVSILSGRNTDRYIGGEPVIVAAQDLAPSETVQMDRTKVLAFITELGSSNSHTAILARTMNLPALAGIPIKVEWDKKLTVVDGDTGILYLDPDEETLNTMKKKQQQEKLNREVLSALKEKETVTKDGKKIALYANIGNISDIDSVINNDGEGIGLFRSEFLYMEKEDYPDEEEQFRVYKEAAERMNGKKVIIRTLDIGADKQASCFELEHEENPAMGYRAIRICLDRKDIFKTQLRALFRASAYGNIAVMYPMIISVSEVLEIKKIVAEVKAELDEENVVYKNVEQGIMIETPAAVMMSKELAQEVDFFSIGTNDLTQFTLAADRQNQKLEHSYDSHHPAVLRMIQMVIVNGHMGGCWVGICGELAGDLTLTETFLKMGIDELSVSPGLVLAVRKTVREIDRSVCEG